MDSRLKVVYYQKISMYGKLIYVHSEFSVNSILDIPSLNAQVRYALGKHTRPQITSPSQEEESGTGYEDHPRVHAFPQRDGPSLGPI